MELKGEQDFSIAPGQMIYCTCPDAIQRLFTCTRLMLSCIRPFLMVNDLFDKRSFLIKNDKSTQLMAIGLIFANMFGTNNVAYTSSSTSSSPSPSSPLASLNPSDSYRP